MSGWLNADELTALWLSAKIALCCMLVCLPIGIGVAWLLARRDFRGRLLVEVLVQLPMVLP
ncbi:MAG: molybdate ABC transporter permease subunit, partial [Solimonas sp.]